ncbi:unnamed protein product [Fraxinus pennsylvanica]|uniref:DUF3700 domain-containing protein n=1 Tax=Fraxinus pennsylvanica TaxID=56036 RepID=A0AAD2AHK8_9LAMI|nr:unnamed protein product [Fraxinus pennsylvanica]
MLAVFEKSISKPPKELILPFPGKSHPNSSREEIAEIYRSWRFDSTFYNVPNGNFLALSHEDENPVHPRSIVVMDDIFCLFSGYLLNAYELRRYYGLSRQATEAMIIVKVYKVLRDRAPYPPDQVVKELDGKFAFILFDSKASVLFLARESSAEFPVCEFCRLLILSGSVLISVDYSLHKVQGISRQGDEGNINAVIFQVDLYTRLHSIRRTDSAENWADVNIVEGE